MDRYQVQMQGVPNDEIPFVRAMRIIGRVSLTDAIKIHSHARNAGGTVLVAGIDRHVADHIAAAFTAAGIAVSVRPSTVTSPMICRPQANAPYRRSLMGAVVSD
jgi:hypothetical protein